MFYQKYEPLPLLKPFVECYYIWEASGIQHLEVASPPSGFTSIVFNYGDAYSAVVNEAQPRKVPKFFLTGQATYKYALRFSGTVGMLGIVFTPAALTTLFRVPMGEFVDERTELTSALGPEIEELGNLLMEEPSRPARIALVQTFLLGQTIASKTAFDAIDIAANKIVKSHGQFDINGLILEANMSRRQFERRFYAKVGLSPKYYGRISRISHICKIMARREQVDWQQVIYDNGFCDQAHFIRNFKEFLGKTPNQYIKSRPELAHLLRDE
jgi:AraC-like DNA-binding protein